MNNVVNALAVFDDGGGPALYAGGSFTTAGGIAANRLARWDGASWTSLGSGVSGGALALQSFRDEDGPALFAGGGFDLAFESGDSFLARWGYSGIDADPPTLSCPASITVIGGPPGEIVSFAVTASDCRDPAPVVECVPPSGSFFPGGTTLVTCTASDAAGNRSTCQFPVRVALESRRR